MRAVGLVLVSSAASCILFVSPEEYGSSCRFKGEDTQCGTCVAARCRREIDDCCRDATCDGSVMPQLDDCNERHGNECKLVKNSSYAISACIARECGAQCEPLSGTATTSCREPRLGEGSACTCKSSGEVNDFICNPAAFPDTLCCAPEAWPAAGLECTCRPLDCRASPVGCFCSLADFTPRQRECSAVHCCVSQDKCTCRSDECALFEREVPSCSITELRCLDGQKEVVSCSERTP